MNFDITNYESVPHFTVALSEVAMLENPIISHYRLTKRHIIKI